MRECVNKRAGSEGERDQGFRMPQRRLREDALVAILIIGVALRAYAG